ncbi:XDD3 family exosortase-dependent surface protein [Thioflexithrix psekupsensis]|uniref:XDD3 family exosortase-dependent surface protein n=1 Tax=Thioflexithrix psekupsensis TaxID=1570016 RepID=UPI0015944EDB|nr:XDD3 family exosortase-dependent surface protein [Thioflexithrix psekupsensis]
MNNRKLTALLVSSCLTSVAYTVPVWGAPPPADSVSITINDNRSSTFQVVLQSRQGNTWTYQVSKAKGFDLSHWVLGIPSCQGKYVSYTAGAEIGVDGSIKDQVFSGIKWNSSGGTFSFTLDGDYATASVPVLVKAANGYAESVMAGPDCTTPNVPDVPVVDEPAPEEPVVDEPVAEEPAPEEPVVDEPVAEEPAPEEPVVDEPVAEEPAPEEPVVDEPVAEEPAPEEPVVDEPPPVAVVDPTDDCPVTAVPIYGVQDNLLNDSQLFKTYVDPVTKAVLVENLGTEQLGMDIEGLAFHPVTSELYVSSGDDAANPEDMGVLYRVDIETGATTRLGQLYQGEVSALTFSADGQKLWGWIDYDGVLVEIDAAALRDGQVTLDEVVAYHTNAPQLHIESLTTGVSSEGHTVLHGAANRDIVSFNVETGALNRCANVFRSQSEVIEMLADGSLLFALHNNQRPAIYRAEFDAVNCGLEIVDKIPMPAAYYDIESLAVPPYVCAVEEPVVEEPVAEEPVVEEPVAEEPVVEEPVVEEPVVEEPVVEEPVVEEPIAEEPVVEEPVAEEPVVEEPVAEEPVVEEPVVEEPVAEEPVVEEPVAEEPVVEEPVAQACPVTPWQTVVDSTNDASEAIGGKTVFGGNGFEVYSLSMKQVGEEVTVVIRTNLPLEGLNYGGKNISWGDLMLDFSANAQGGKVFEMKMPKATKQNPNPVMPKSGVYAVRFSAANDSGVSELGLYDVISNKSVVSSNYGWSSLKNYLDNAKVDFSGNPVVPSLGHVSIDNSYFANFDKGGKVPTSIVAGNFLGGLGEPNLDAMDDFDHTTPAGVVFDKRSAMYGVTMKDGNPPELYTIAFSFTRTPEMTGAFTAYLFTECMNDGVALKGVFEDCPDEE